LQDEVSQLQATVAAQNEKIAALESAEEQDVSRLALDIAFDRQRLARLEKVEPQPMQRDRADILRALLAANGGKMLAKDARQKMRLDKATFSRLLDTLKDDITVKPLRMDKRKLVLMLKIS
jgi:DNA-binding MarR family transcriptional regulator